MNVQIQVLDDNDNSPSFSESFPQISVVENRVETNIYHVEAQDRDAGSNGRIIFLLENSNDAFYINPNVIIVVFPTFVKIC